MPITIKPAPHGANAVSKKYTKTVENALDLLESVSYKDRENVQTDGLGLIQTSFNNLPTSNSDDMVLGKSNGFVDTALKAYNGHHHLTIRPDDVWIAMLAQLNIYINTNAERASPYVCRSPSYKMSKMIEKNIKDPTLRQWILPSFSTTTKTDQAVACIMMMSTLQKYFSYSCCILCGLPSVTLLGEKEDWEAIATKAERLPTFGKECETWYGLLKPVLKRFVESFDSPESKETKHFWQRICHRTAFGSGSAYLSGWITASCFWDDQGRLLFSDRMIPKPVVNVDDVGYDTPGLELDGVEYHAVDTVEIPPGWASVPVKVNDNGNVTECKMVAGSVGFRLSSSGKALHDTSEGEKTGLDTISIENGWWMYAAKDGEALKKAREEGNAKYKAGEKFKGGNKKETGTSTEEDSDSDS